MNSNHSGAWIRMPFIWSIPKNKKQKGETKEHGCQRVASPGSLISRPRVNNPDKASLTLQSHLWYHDFRRNGTDRITGVCCLPLLILLSPFLDDFSPLLIVLPNSYPKSIDEPWLFSMWSSASPWSSISPSWCRRWPSTGRTSPGHSCSWSVPWWESFSWVMYSPIRSTIWPCWLAICSLGW